MSNKTKRLSINLPVSVHNNLKKRAARYHITLTRWVLRSIIERIIKEDNLT